jgi:hypothetical protein
MMTPLSFNQLVGTLLLGAALLAAGTAGAQTAAPAPAPAPDAAPAVNVDPDSSNSSSNSGTPGTTIIGDKESPIGLYLTPWKNEYADRDMDRAAQFVQGDMKLVDPQVFDRQIQYYDRINAYRQNEPAAGKK